MLKIGQILLTKVIHICPDESVSSGEQRPILSDRPLLTK